jgi:hypothetical protein
MIDARQRLLGNARGLFETELRGVFSWDEVQHHVAEPAEPLPNGRRNPLGKHKERVVLEFGRFRLEVSSPEEVPPLGKIELYSDGELRAQGPLDANVWARVGSVIKERQNGR